MIDTAPGLRVLLALTLVKASLVGHHEVHGLDAGNQRLPSQIWFGERLRIWYILRSSAGD